MSNVRIIIAGGRDFDDYQMLEKEVFRVIRETFGAIPRSSIEFISGGANGADKLGERMAAKYGFIRHRIPAKWDVYGKRAGFIRNVEMAMYAKGNPDEDVIPLVIAFWDGNSKGTKHMIETAEKHGIKVVVVRYEN